MPSFIEWHNNNMGVVYAFNIILILVSLLLISYGGIEGGKLSGGKKTMIIFAVVLLTLHGLHQLYMGSNMAYLHGKEKAFDRLDEYADKYVADAKYSERADARLAKAQLNPGQFTE
jgi:hypothetical protein